MQLILFDDKSHFQLLPFTHTRPVADVRCGIFTQRERWEHYFQTDSSASLVAGYMQAVFPLQFSEEQIYVNGAVFGRSDLAELILQMPEGTAVFCQDLLVAYKSRQQFKSLKGLLNAAESTGQKLTAEVNSLQQVWDIFALNEQAIIADFKWLVQGRKSEPIPAHVTVLCPENIFIEPGATVQPSIINATAGPVYIGKDAEIMEGGMIRGPLALCQHAVLKMGAKVYGATTIGPGCKVGGELGNVVFFANSNKGHDGYLGNSVIGEWCNLGADTNSSNLKNNYDVVKIWNEHENKSVKTGLQFCGLLMADHSKCGINTMFNTGTVVGVSCNIYGGGFPDKFIPSFSWGGKDGMMTYQLHKAIDTANRMMMRRERQLSEAEHAMLSYIFEQTAEQRNRLYQH